jgi:hypothetical protein
LLTKIIIGDAAPLLEISPDAERPMDCTGDDHHTYLMISSNLRRGLPQLPELIG